MKIMKVHGRGKRKNVIVKWVKDSNSNKSYRDKE